MDTVDFDQLPVYHDELYLELHRACQTTQARTKRNNRTCELALRDAELLSTVAALDGFPYPRQRLTETWKPLLTNQFHDILPGSSVKEVYEDADEDYARVLESAHEMRREASEALLARIDTRGEGRPVVVFNTLGWPRTDVASLELTDDDPQDVQAVDADGNPVLSQVVERDGGRALLFEVRDVPSLGHAVYRVVDGSAGSATELEAGERRLENEFFVVELDGAGRISRMLDKRAGREVVPRDRPANDLQLFEDRPYAHDAWDIDFNFEENALSWNEDATLELVDEGPLRATVRVTKRTDASTLVQEISIWRSLPRVDFDTRVDWHEKHVLLKAAFPVSVVSRRATYEVQYGAIERPTHFSSSQDRARFEVPGHRWVDLSETGWGASLLNDCKYGFDTHDGVMRISLLRAPTSPDPGADEGEHLFTYCLYPHKGGWQEAGTVRRAYELNAPLVVRRTNEHAGSFAPVGGFAAVDADNVVIDCVKTAEDGDEVIIRLYEAHGARGPVTLTFPTPPETVTECDLMEENDVAVDHAGVDVRFEIAPWEIRTFKCLFEKEPA